MCLSSCGARWQRCSWRWGEDDEHNEHNEEDDAEESKRLYHSDSAGAQGRSSTDGWMLGPGLVCFPNVEPPLLHPGRYFVFPATAVICNFLITYYSPLGVALHPPRPTRHDAGVLLLPIIASNSTTSQQRLNWQQCHHHHQDSPTRLLAQTPRQLPPLRARFTTVSSSSSSNHSSSVLLDEVIPQLQVLPLQFLSFRPASAMQAQTRSYARFTRSSPPPAHVAPYFLFSAALKSLS